MIRVAEPRDFKDCQKLLKQIRSSEQINQDYLYLNDRTNGFTLIVEKDAKLVALSTFTIRKTYENKKIHSFLYWENLIVDRFNRDGLAYLSIIGYVRKLLRSGEFDDIFCVVFRKKALAAHKAARFKTFGYFQLMIESVNFGRSDRYQTGLSCLNYRDFSKLFNSEQADHPKSLKQYVGLENASNIEIQRWLFGKEGKIILDDLNKRIYFLRSLFRNKFFEINLCVPSGYTETFPNLSEFCSSLISINLKIRRCTDKRHGVPWYLPKLTYEAIFLKEKKSLNSFEIWEHDAW
jgi:hypothetical protein